MTVNYLDPDEFKKYLDDHSHIAKMQSASDFHGEVTNFFHGKTVDVGDGMPFGSMTQMFKFRPGEVSIWTGFSGHGKSLLLGQVMSKFMLQDKKKVAIASMEMKPVTTLNRMVRQYFESSKPSVEELDGWFAALGDVCWIYNHQGVAIPNELIAAMKYSAKDLGVNHFVIDSLLKCGLPEDDLTAQKNFVDQLCSVARDSKMHIHLVCHARKAENEMKIPGKHDIRGSAAISDQVDNVIVVWRNKDEKRPIGEDAIISIEKQRNGEFEGKTLLSYNQAGQSFNEFGNKQWTPF